MKIKNLLVINDSSCSIVLCVERLRFFLSKLLFDFVLRNLFVCIHNIICIEIWKHIIMLICLCGFSNRQRVMLNQFFKHWKIKCCSIKCVVAQVKKWKERNIKLLYQREITVRFPKRTHTITENKPQSRWSIVINFYLHVRSLSLSHSLSLSRSYFLQYSFLLHHRKYLGVANARSP